MTGNSEGRYAALLDAQHPDGRRTQWLVLAPAAEWQPVAFDPEQIGRLRYIKRRKTAPDARAQWDTHEMDGPAAVEKLALELRQYATTGYDVRAPIVVELEEDDYRRAWSGARVDTPHKCLRHVAKWARLRGYDL